MFIRNNELIERLKLMGIKYDSIVGNHVNGNRIIDNCPLTDEKIASFHSETTKRLAVEMNERKNEQNEQNEL